MTGRTACSPGHRRGHFSPDHSPVEYIAQDSFSFPWDASLRPLHREYTSSPIPAQEKNPAETRGLYYAGFPVFFRSCLSFSFSSTSPRAKRTPGVSNAVLPGFSWFLPVFAFTSASLHGAKGRRWGTPSYRVRKKLSYNGRFSEADQSFKPILSASSTSPGLYLRHL